MNTTPQSQQTREQTPKPKQEEDCNACDGFGELRYWEDGELEVDRCAKCNGTGKLSPTKPKQGSDL